MSSNYSLGRARLPGGWREEYVKRHSKTEVHEAAISIQVQREAAHYLITNLILVF